MSDVTADFYVTEATVIPVIFLALVLQSGLWVRLGRRITRLSSQRTRLSLTITVLQFFARIPGLVWVNLDAIKLDLEDGEELCWSAPVPQFPGSIVRTPKIRGVGYEMADPRQVLSGKMFITNKRLVWIPPGEMGSLGGRRIEIRAGEFDSVDWHWPPGLSRLGIPWRDRIARLLMTLAFSPLVVRSADKRSYAFYVSAKHADIMPHLTALCGAGRAGQAAAPPDAPPG